MNQRRNCPQGKLSSNHVDLFTMSLKCYSHIWCGGSAENFSFPMCVVGLHPVVHTHTLLAWYNQKGCRTTKNNNAVVWRTTNNLLPKLTLIVYG